MVENTAIEWATHTFNPWVGCTKVSPACDHCYAEAWAKRTGAPELWHGLRRRTTDANWRKVDAWNRDASRNRRRDRVFVASLADVFDNQIDPDWRDDLWTTIRMCGALDFLLLTKRPQNIAKMLPEGWGRGWPNVWLGATCENQEEADRRTPHLRANPAVVHFLSCEPLLQAIRPNLSGIGWLIVGGESGHGARMMAPVWARSLRDQCAVAGVAFFMKQMSGKATIPPDLMVREFPSAQ